jgi:hypothetical protein
MKPGHAVSLIEAAYRFDCSTEQWLERVATAGAVALGSALGAMAFRYDATRGNWVLISATGVSHLPPEFARDYFNHPDMPPEAATAMAGILKATPFGSVRAVFERLQFTPVCDVLDRYGIDDMLAINGLDPSGRGCMLMIADRKRQHSPRTMHLWHRLAAHISAGNRLHGTLESLAQDYGDLARHAEAVLTPNGKRARLSVTLLSVSMRPARSTIIRDALLIFGTASSRAAGRSSSISSETVSATTLRTRTIPTSRKIEHSHRVNAKSSATPSSGTRTSSSATHWGFRRRRSRRY